MSYKQNFKDFVDSKFDSVKSKFKSKGIKIIKWSLRPGGNIGSYSFLFLDILKWG